MTSIELVPTENGDINHAPQKKEHDEEDDVSPPEPVEHQAEDVSEQSQNPNSQEGVTPETTAEQSEAPPTPKPKGRPRGSKNKAPRKASVKLEPVPEPLKAVVEEPPIEEEPPTTFTSFAETRICKAVVN